MTGRLLAPLAAALVMLVAACGGDGSPTPSPTVAVIAPTTPAATTATAAPPAATATPAPTAVTAFALTSSAFADGGAIPARFTCDGDDVSPPLAIAGSPSATAVLVLVIDDPDAPAGTWDHWVVYDIAPAITIAEGASGLGTDGTNSWEDTGYGGPCPPSGTHHYGFHLWALDAPLGLPPGARADAVRAAMAGHMLAETVLTGTYSR